MSIATFIRDNTDDGRNIVRFLIDVMEGNIDGCTLSHRLTAARLLTVYVQVDSPDNAPETSDRVNGRKILVEMDPELRTLIKAMTDDGRVLCTFLIDVMEGKYEGAHPRHRVTAARELLNRGFGKTSSPRMRGPTRSLPRTSRPSAPHRTTRRKKNQMTPESARFQAAVDERPAVQIAVLDEPEPPTQPEAVDIASGYREPDWDPLDIDEERLQYFEACYDDNFDPYEAAQNLVYAESYKDCSDPECEVHGNPPPLDFDPNDFHY